MSIAACNMTAAAAKPATPTMRETDSVKPRRAIYFAVDDSRRMLSQVTTCVQSIRATGCRLPIHVVLAGETRHDTTDLSRDLSARLIFAPWDQYPRFVRRQPTFLKWFALRERFDYDELLYLDADTFAFRDPTDLFEALGPENVHARCSYQALETRNLETRGLLLVRPPGCMPSYQRRYQALRRHLGIESMFGLNTGIMVFKNRSHRRIEEHLSLFRMMRNMLYRGVLPYPIPTRFHVMEEVVARLVLGFLGDFTWKEIPDALCPYYIDSYQSLGAPPAILIHTFRGYYAHFLYNQFGKEACERYLAIPGPPKGETLKLAVRSLWIVLLHASRISSAGESFKCALAETLVRGEIGRTHGSASGATRQPG